MFQEGRPNIILVVEMNRVGFSEDTEGSSENDKGLHGD
jgi:hypothetical protein